MVKTKEIQVLLDIYALLPTTVDIKTFTDGHGNWGLTETEYEIVKLIIKHLKRLNYV